MFTERERGLLEEWLEVGVEGQGVRDIFSKIRERCAAGGGRGADAAGGGEAAGVGEVAGPVDGGERVRLEITCRRVRVDAGERKRSYIARLERLMAECDGMISDPGGYEEVQVRAMGVLIRAVKVCYGMVGDVAVEQLEGDVERLKARIGELAEAG